MTIRESYEVRCPCGERITIRRYDGLDGDWTSHHCEESLDIEPCDLNDPYLDIGGEG